MVKHLESWKGVFSADDGQHTVEECYIIDDRTGEEREEALSSNISRERSKSMSEFGLLKLEELLHR